MQTGKALVDAVVATKQAIQVLDAAFEALDAWMTDVIAIAKISLGGTQLSEAIGNLERS